MNYENFLNSLEEADLRNKLWELFLKVEQEAKLFPIDSQDWVVIREVVKSHRNMWHANGLIEIIPKWDDLGVLFHETFHSAFHNSPLWRDDNKRDWGDGFCDAFRYFMGDRCGGDNRWLDDIKKYLPKDPEEILENRRNVGWKLDFCIPCTRIVNKADKDYDTFKMMWKELNEDPDVSLEEYFDYPKTELSRRFRT